MKISYRIGTAVGVLALLGGCASYDVEGVAAMADKGGAYASALHKRYIERAQFEVGEGDWQSVAFFNDRARLSSQDQAPMLQKPEERRLKVDKDAIAKGYTSLAAALRTNAPSATPDACARAQTWFEHWMEQSEEGHQPDHIAQARGEFEKALPECQGQMPMAKMPDAMIVYFDHDSAVLTGASLSTIKAAADAAKTGGVAKVVLIGHADRSGADDYNMALSRARVAAVGKALADAGVGAKMVEQTQAGETSPQVKTDDGVRERMNRRVEIVFQK